MASRRAAKDPAVRVELTARHEEVLGLIAAGKTNGEIAEALGVTLDGAKWHVREILSRLGAETREEAVERWRERQSGRRRRPWAWFGWPVAAAIGAVGVVGAGAVLVVAGMGGIVALSGGGNPGELEQPEVARREQPTLTPVGEGDGWRAWVDEAGGVPHARDAVLALRWDGLQTEVALIEARSGRVGARWELGYRPTAVLRPSRNEVLISHHAVVSAGEPRGPELMRFSLDDVSAPPEVRELPGRIDYTVGITQLALSADERWLYYIAEALTQNCPGSSLPGASDQPCPRYRVGVVDLGDRSDVRFHPVGNTCGPFAHDPKNDAGVMLTCSNTQHGPGPFSQYFAVDSRRAVEMTSPPGLLTFGAGSGWIQGLIDGRLVDTTIINAYAEDQGLMVSVFSPPFEPPVNTDATKRWSYPGLASVVGLNEPGKALGVMSDGDLVAIDLDTGELAVLPYGLPPAPFGDVVLTR